MSFEQIISVIADFASIVGVLGVVIAFIAVRVAYRQALTVYEEYKVKQKRASLENAVNLARIYEQEILKSLFWIRNVFENSHMSEFIKSNLNIGALKTVRFTLSEMKSISGNENISQLFNTEFLKIDTSFIQLNKSLYANYELSTTKKDTSEMLSVFILEDFMREIYRLLNSLEWFSMNFTKNIADESAVYQSLHQTFISCIRYLYYFIAIKNKTASEKLYTNLIELYNLWNTRLAEKSEEEVAKLKEVNKRAELNGVSIQKEIEHTGEKL